MTHVIEDPQKQNHVEHTNALGRQFEHIDVHILHIGAKYLARQLEPVLCS